MEENDQDSAVDQYSAVVFWVDEVKVGQVPIELISEKDRSVGTYTWILPPGFQKEYLGRIEGISDDPDTLNRIESEVSQRIDEDKAKVSEKRPRTQVRRFGKAATEAALQVASGQRRQGPSNGALALDNKATTTAARVANANRKRAQSSLTKLIHSSLPSAQTKKASAKSSGNSGKKPVGSLQANVKKNQLSKNAGNSVKPASYTKRNQLQVDEDSLLNMGYESDILMDTHEEMEEDDDLEDAESNASSPPEKLRKKAQSSLTNIVQTTLNSVATKKAPAKNSDNSLKMPSNTKRNQLSKVNNDSLLESGNKPEILIDTHEDMDVDEMEETKESETPTAGSNLLSPSMTQDSFDFSDTNRAAFFRAMKLKKMFTPSAKTFVTELLDFMVNEANEEEDCSEIEYIDHVSPPPNVKQIEISKGSGVCITAASKQVILLTGTKNGPARMLTGLVHELFQEKLKLIRGTATIRPNTLKAIISFMDKNTEKSLALGSSDIKRVINNLACEARRVRKQSPKAGKPSKGKTPSPSKTTVSPPSVVTTPSKNKWNVDTQVQPPPNSVAASVPQHNYFHSHPSSYQQTEYQQTEYQQYPHQYNSYDYNHHGFNNHYSYQEYPATDQVSSKSPRRILEL